MKILVTGASGFLGSQLCPKLKSLGHEVMGLSSKIADLTKSESLKQFNTTQWDYIFHLAAWTQAGDFCLYHPGEQWIINQHINTNVLHWWSESQPQAKLISMGTSCAYDPLLPLIEDNYLEGKPIQDLFTYAMTKRMLYTGMESLNKQYGMKYLCVVPSTLYGPGYHTQKKQMHFIYDLIRKILNAKFHGEAVILWGDGYQRRELVFIHDFVDILIHLAFHVDNEIFNIGAGEEFTIRHFAEIISELVDYDSSLINYDETRYVGAKSKCLDIKKLKQFIPNLNLSNLQDSLAVTVDWFIKATQIKETKEYV